MAESGLGTAGIVAIPIPAGGAAGEVLTKDSAANYDMIWAPGGGGGPASTDWLEFVAQAANPGTIPAVTLYMDDGTNFDVNTVAMGDLTIPMMLTGNVGFGDPGFEQGGIDVGGVTFDATAKVNDFGGTVDAMMVLHRHSTSFGSNLVFSRSNSDTSAHAAMTPGQTISQQVHVGWSGTHYDIAAFINVDVPTGTTVSPTSLAGEMSFYTTPDLSNISLLAMIIGSDQIIYGDIVPGGTLDLQGSQAANRGSINIHGNTDIDFDWSTDVGFYALSWAQTIPASGGGIVGFMNLANVITVDTATFISSSVDDQSTLTWTVAPGFAVQTLFFARPTYQSTTVGIPPSQAFIYAAQAQYRLTGAGAVTVPTYRALSFAPIFRVDNAGDDLSMTNTDGITVGPLYNTRNATAVADYGTIRGVHMLNAGTVFFGQALGSEIADNWIGLDVELLSGLVVSGVRAAVRSAIIPAASNFFLQNLGGAQSDFGSGSAHWNDNEGVTFGGTVAAPDVQIGWDSANNTLNFNPAVGADMEFAFGVSGGSDFYLFEAENFPGPVATPVEIRFGFDRFAFGQAGAIGNQVGLFVAGTREVGVAGGWADYLLTQGGSLDITTFAMSDVSAWVINLISLANATGSITDLSTFVIGGMTTSNPGITVTERHAMRVTGRSKFRGSLQYQPIVPAALSAGNNNDWAGLLTGSPNNNTRYWARVSGNASGSDITGIDSTAVQDGDTFEITNVSANIIRLMHQDTNSSAANRIINQNGNNFVLKPEGTVTVRYDSTTARWRITTEPGAVLPLESEYRFDSTITMADPGSGDFRNNNATLASVTAIAISDISYKGGDASNVLGALASGDQLYIQNKSAGDEFMVFDITSTVDNTTWWQINGTVNSSGTAFTSNNTFGIVFIFA